MNSIANSNAVPFNDLGRGTQALRTQIDAAVDRVLSSGWYVLGPEHDALESELGRYMGESQSVLVGNGTDALQLALTALGVAPGDTVLTAANAGGYTSTAVRSLGAVPVYADVDPNTLLLTVETLEQALSGLEKAPRVVVITHLFGTAADMTSIMAWAEARNLTVIEDCAQSLGAMHNGARAGTFGKISTTSFYPTKNLGALGDGGALFTSDPDVAARLRQLRQYGWVSKYTTSVPGGRNSRMDELQAAIVRVKLPLLDGWNERRRQIHEHYERAISGNARLVNRSTPEYVGHLAVVDVEDRDRARKLLSDLGITTDVHYPTPDHLQPLVASERSVELPVTEAAANRIFSVPLFPDLTDQEVERVASALGSL